MTSVIRKIKEVLISQVLASPGRLKQAVKWLFLKSDASTVSHDQSTSTNADQPNDTTCQPVNEESRKRVENETKPGESKGEEGQHGDNENITEVEATKTNANGQEDIPITVPTEAGIKGTTSQDGGKQNKSDNNSTSTDETGQSAECPAAGTSERDEEDKPTGGGPRGERPNPSNGTKPPTNHGGQRGPKGNNVGEPSDYSTQPKLDLKCREATGQGYWEIFLTSNYETFIVAVHQDGERLECVEEKWCIRKFNEDLQVSTNDSSELTMSLIGNEPLIFKLAKDWRGEGRRVSQITNGHFIVIAPTYYEREGRAPVEPEFCKDRGYKAHFFNRDSDEDTSVGGFKGYAPLATSKGIQLSGNSIYDDSTEGKLFVGKSLELTLPTEINWVRVGEEVKKGWGKNYLQEDDSLVNILESREGRFFLRTYNNTSSTRNLMDSTDFRRSLSLKQITVTDEEYTADTILLPSRNGHSRTEIRLLDENGAILKPTKDLKSPLEVVESGIILVPANPDADRIEAQLSDGKAPLKVVIELPRIWWCLVDTNTQTNSWQDTPLEMTRKQFQDYADEGTKIAIRLYRVSQISAGFGDQIDRSYKRRTQDNQIVVPMSDFGYYEQIDEPLAEDICFRIKIGEETISLVNIAADPAPKITSFLAQPSEVKPGERTELSWTIENAGDIAINLKPRVGKVEATGSHSACLTKTTTFTLSLCDIGIEDINSTLTVKVVPSRASQHGLVAEVKSPSRSERYRRGRGFSHGELLEAGLTLEEAKHLPLRIDRRRRTTHPQNVENLKEAFNV